MINESRNDWRERRPQVMALIAMLASITQVLQNFIFSTSLNSVSTLNSVSAFVICNTCLVRLTVSRAQNTL